MRNFASILTSSLTLILSACDNANLTEPENNVRQISQTPLPPLANYISCLPQEAALIAAHRGTVRNTKYPENSMSALNALIDKGYLVSEIDVAGLKDGVHILFHDGVWDEKSTGKGPVASSTWDDTEKILLKDTKGGFSADRPVKFDDYLQTAKGKIYLEIDFKSSAKYEKVISLIRKHNMADQVILISYNEGQSRKLSKLAPEMMLSIGPNEALGQTRYKPGQVAAWVGYNIDDDAIIKSLQEKQIPILSRIKKDWNAKAANVADLLVTDGAFDHRPIAGLDNKSKDKLEICLNTL